MGVRVQGRASHRPRQGPLHRVGVAFPEGLELLPFYENLAERQLLPFYAHFLSVTFTVLPQTHVFIGVLRVPPPPATPGMSLCDLGAMLGSRPPHHAPHRMVPPHLHAPEVVD